MAPNHNGIEEEVPHLVTDSPDQLSLAEAHEDEEGHQDKGVENGDAHGGQHSDREDEGESEDEEEETEDGEDASDGEQEGGTAEAPDAPDARRTPEHSVDEPEHNYTVNDEGEGLGSEDEDDDDDDDDDDDEEPALKYERLGGSVHDLLQKDSASTLASCNQRLVRHSLRMVLLN